MKFWKRIFPYLVLNVIVSATTTLLVLTLWDRSQSPATPLFSGSKPDMENTLPALPPSGHADQASATLPPLDTPVIEIEAIIGAGDQAAEALILKRVGEGELLLTGWKISMGAARSSPSLTWC